MTRHSPLSRRRVLGGLLAGGSLALAGCLGDESDEDSDDEGDAVDPELELNGRTLSSGFPMQLFDPETDQLVGEVHYHSDERYRHWHFMPLEVPDGETTTAIAEVIDEDLEVIPVGEDEQFRLEMYPTDDTPEDRLDVDVSGDVVRVRGLSPGEGYLRAALIRNADDELLWQSPALWVQVVEK